MKINGFKIEIFEDVYKPSEDTFLLYDSINNNYSKSFEVGSGVGLITLKLAKKSNYVLVSDINFEATKNTLYNVKQNFLRDKVDIVCGDCLTFLKNKIFFELIVFNPPYLPSENFNKKIFDLSWSGGKRGYEITLKFLKEAKKHINKKGTIMIVSSSYIINEVLNIIKKMKLKYSIKKEKSMFFEKIYIVEIKK
ncbi:MAG: methyltransferase [Candidatus Aenigmatarchaeota archaeon]